MIIFPDYLTHISMPQFLNILSNICQCHEWNSQFLKHYMSSGRIFSLIPAPI